jgi:hypothetical protein
MRTIQKTVYNFNELSDEAKEKAINSFRNDPIDFEFEADSVMDNWKERLQEIGFEDAEIQYSGFYHQGDGASFVSDIDIHKVFNAMVQCDKINREKVLLYNKVLYMDELKIVELLYMVYRIDSRYCHENTVAVDSDSEFYLNECPDAYDYFDKIFEQLRDDIQDYVHELCQEIFFDLRRSYEYIQSDEYISETICINEYEFYEDGTMY